MTKDQLVTQIGARIRTASRNFITAAEILLELNRQIDVLHGVVNIEDTIVTTSISFSGNGTFTWASLGITDVKEPISLYDGSNRLKFKRMSLSGLQEALPSSTTSTFNMYAVTPSGITVYGVSSPATLTFRYYSTNDCFDSGGVLRKGLSATTDYPALQSRYHDYFVEKTSGVLFRKERKYDDYKIAKAEAEEMLANIYADNPDQRETIVQTSTSYPETFN